MKTAKNIIVAILIIVTIFSLAGCQSKQNDEKWLPLGLKFGMTYEEFSNSLTEQGVEVPELQSADSNQGYLTTRLYFTSIEEDDLYRDIFSTEKLSENMSKEEKIGYELDSIMYNLSKVNVAFSFNQDKELYEMYYSFEWTDDKIKESIGTIRDYYNEKMKGNFVEMENTLGMWKNDELAVSIQNFGDVSEIGTELIAIIMHNFDYDLNS